MDELRSDIRAMREEIHAVALEQARLSALVHRVESLETEQTRLRELATKISGGVSLAIAVIAAAIKFLVGKGDS